MSSTAQIESPIIEEPRPRSAPHPSRQRKVAPLLQIAEHLQDAEIRPHSSPPCVAQNDVSGNAQRKPFKNRIHPSSATVNADIPSALHSEETDSNVSDETPLIPSTTEQNPSAIGSAMSPKRLFNRPKWTASHSNRILFDRFNSPIDTESVQDTEVITNRFAPDVLIVEDISDVSSLSSFTGEEKCQPSVEQCQPGVEQHVHSDAKCNILSVSSSGGNDDLPLVSIEPLVVPHNKMPNTSQSTDVQSPNQMLSSNRSQSAMTFSIYNNLDLPIGKFSNSVTPDKNLNYKTVPTIGNNNLLSPIQQKTIYEPKADVKPMHLQQESLCAEQQKFARNESHLLDQNLLMEDQKCHQNKETAMNMQSRIRNPQEQTIVETSVNQPSEQVNRCKEPLKQTEPIKAQNSERTSRIEPKRLHGNGTQHKRPTNYVDQNRQDGATRPKLHGRSQTEQALPLDREAGGAVGLYHHGRYNPAFDADRVRTVLILCYLVLD